MTRMRLRAFVLRPDCPATDGGPSKVARNLAYAIRGKTTGLTTQEQVGLRRKKRALREGDWT